MIFVLASIMLMLVATLIGSTTLSMITGVLSLLMTVFTMSVSIYVESFAKRETQVETYKLLKIGYAWYKEHAPWKRLVMYEDETGEVDTLLCDESEFEIADGDDKTLTIEISTPVYPKWMEMFKLLQSSGAPSSRIIITIPNETEQQNVEK